MSHKDVRRVRRGLGKGNSGKLERRGKHRGREGGGEEEVQEGGLRGLVPGLEQLSQSLRSGKLWLCCHR